MPRPLARASAAAIAVVCVLVAPLRADSIPSTSLSGRDLPSPPPLRTVAAPERGTAAAAKEQVLFQLLTLGTYNPNYAVSTLPGRAVYVTPTYTSLGAQRSVSLAYSSAQAAPRGLVQVYAQDLSGVRPSRYLLRLRRPDNSLVTFTNGLTEIAYETAPNVNNINGRALGAQFDASSLPTGAYSYTAEATAVYPDSSRREATLPLRILIVNETASPFGAGWSVPGMQRLVVQTDGSIVATGGDGSAAYFYKPCSSCLHQPPPGDFTRITLSSGTYTRAFPDSTREAYNSLGRLTSVTDRLGNTTSYGYYPNGTLWYVQDPAGLRMTFVYNSAGKLSTITDPGGRVTTVTVNSSGDLTEILDPAGGYALRATYDASHRLLEQTDRRGSVWTNAYHATGAMDSLQMPAVPVLRGATEQTVRPTVRYRSVEEAVVPPAGTGTPTTLAPMVWGTEMVVTDPRGNHTTHRLNQFGRSEYTQEPRGRATTTLYNYNGQVTFTRDPAGRERNFWWTGANLDSVHDATTGRRMRYQYGAFNQRVQVTDGTLTSVRTLNARGLVASEGLSGGSATTYTYDTRGRLTQITDPVGHSTRMFHAATGWMNTDSVLSDTAGGSTRFTYDGLGRVRTVRTPVGQVSTRYPDALNRDSMVVSAAGDTVQYEYDGMYLSRVRLPGGASHQFVNTALGWKRVQVDAAGDSTYAYRDENGNVLKLVNRRGEAVTFTYDALNQMKTRTADGLTSHFAYDSLGLWVASANLEAVDTTWVNLRGQRVKEVTHIAGRRFERTYAYDMSGRRAGTYINSNFAKDMDTGYDCPLYWYQGGSEGKQWCLNNWSISNSYDAYGQLQSVTSQGNWFDGTDEYDQDAYEQVYVLTATMGYNADRQAVSTTVGSTTISRSFTREHGLGSIQFTPDSINVALGGTYQRDLMGRVHYRYNSNSTALDFYNYDTRGQVSGFGTAMRYAGQWVQTSSFAAPFDRSGNPTDSGAVVLPGNRLQEYRGADLTWDADGNLHRLQLGSGVDRYYWFGTLGELTGAMNVVDESEGVYGYDANGRRVRKGYAGDGATYYLYDGENLLAEVGDWGNVTRAYVYYPGIDRPLAVVQNDSVYYYLTDDPGNVVGLVRPNGSLANRYRYSPFGEMLFSRESVPNDLQFGALPYDDATGLYYVRARYYSPFLRRFISEDPLGATGGANLYAYAGNDPVNRFDPLGLQSDDTECRWIEVPPGTKDAIGSMYTGWWRLECTLETLTVVASPEPGPLVQGWVHAWQRLGEFLSGTGPSQRDYGPGSGEVADMKTDPSLDRARHEFCTALENGETSEYTGIGFGLSGLLRAGLNPTRQYVGSYGVTISTQDGETANIVINNKSSVPSFFYQMTDQQWERWQWNSELSRYGLGVSLPLGNTYQTFRWTENISDICPS